MEILFIVVAFILGYLFLKLGLPPLLGYLTGGFVLAFFGFEGSHALDELSHIGVILLLFTLGLKIRLRNFLQPEVAVSGLLQIVLSVFVLSGIFTVIGLNAGFATSQTLLLGILLGVASTVIAAKGLENKGEMDAYHGRLAIGILVMEDIILIAILAFAGLKAPSPWALALLLLPLARPLVTRLVRTIQSDELLLLYGILMGVGGALLFERLGLGSELGAFCFGVLHAGEDRAQEISKKLWSLREAFLVSFFLKIGLTGIPGWKDLGYALALLLVLPLRVGIFFLLLTRFRLRARTAFLTSTSLASFSEFALITGAIAISVGLLPASLLITLATIVAVSFLIGAPVNSQANYLYNRLEPLLVRFESEKSRSDAEPVNIGAANYIVVGMGRTGSAAYDSLVARDKKVVGFDSDPAVLARQRTQKRRAIYADSNSKNLWENLDISRLEGAVIAMREESGKFSAIEGLRNRGFKGQISAVVESEAQAGYLKEAGVDTMCSPLVQAGEELAEKVVNG